MKKTQAALQQKRRLSLNRETLRFLSDPALLGLARGRGPDPTFTLPTQQQESTSQGNGNC